MEFIQFSTSASLTGDMTSSEIMKNSVLFVSQNHISRVGHKKSEPVKQVTKRFSLL